MPDMLTDEDLQRVHEAVRSKTSEAIIAIRAIAEEVSWASGIPVDTILSESRKANLVALRRIIMFRAHMQGLSSVQIGRAMLLDHSTVLEGIKKERAARAAKEEDDE